MRKILTFGLFLAFICSAAAQNRRGVTLVQQDKESHGVIKWPGFRFPMSISQDTVSLVILGDMMMHSEQIAKARKEDGSHDFSGYFTNVSHLFKDADITVANMEFTLAGRPYTGYPCFSAPDNYANSIAESGVDVFLTANNHILDKGRNGIERTLGIYSEMERNKLVRHTGSAASAADDSLRFPLKVTAKGIRIALINFTYGTNLGLKADFPKVHRIDTSEIAGAIRKARGSGADFIIALPHWGNEYVLEHSASQKKLASWLAERGCDAVIGSHPHVLQDVEILTVPDEGGEDGRKVPVAYSLGNFISNMSAPNTQLGMMVTLRFTKDGLGDKNMLEPELTLTWCSRPGNLNDGYTTIPVKEYLGKRDLWIRPSDYDKMVATYKSVKETTGIKD